MMRLEMRMEIHDDACIRCAQPKPSGAYCVPCALESAQIESAGEASIGRVIDEVEAARDLRRKENEENR